LAANKRRRQRRSQIIYEAPNFRRSFKPLASNTKPGKLTVQISFGIVLSCGNHAKLNRRSNSKVCTATHYMVPPISPTGSANRADLDSIETNSLNEIRAAANDHCPTACASMIFCALRIISARLAFDAAVRHLASQYQFHSSVGSNDALQCRHLRGFNFGNICATPCRVINANNRYLILIYDFDIGLSIE